MVFPNTIPETNSVISKGQMPNANWNDASSRRRVANPLKGNRRPDQKPFKAQNRPDENVSDQKNQESTKNS